MSLSNLQHSDYHKGCQALLVPDIPLAIASFKSLSKQIPSAIPKVVTLLLKLNIQCPSIELQLGIVDLLIMGEYWVDAILELDELLEEHPLESKGYERLGKIWNRHPHFSQIEAILERGLATPNFDPSITDLLSRIYMRRLDYEASIHLYQTLLQNQPNTTHYRVTIANLLMKSERYEDALAEWIALSEQAPLQTPMILTQLNELAQHLPNHIQLLVTLIRLNCQLCQPDAACQRANELLNWHPKEAPVLNDILDESLSILPHSVDIELVKSRTLVHCQRYSESMAILFKLLDMPDCPHIPTIQAIAEEIIALFPAQVLAHELLCEIAMRQGSFRTALFHIAQLANYDQPNCDYLFKTIETIQIQSPSDATQAELMKAKLLLNTRQYSLAIESTYLIQDMPAKLDAMLIRASALEYLGHCYEADDELIQGIQQHPHEPILHHHLMAFKRRWVEHQINNASSEPICHQLGLLYLAKQEYQMALDTFNQLEQGPTALKALCQCLLGRTLQGIELAKQVTPVTPLTECVLQMGALQLGRSDAQLDDTPLILWGCMGQHPPLQMGVVLCECSSPPSFAHPHHHQGVHYMMNGHFKAAEDSFKLALQMDPTLGVSHLNLCALYLLQHQLDDAWNTLIRSKPLQDHGMTPLYRGLILFHQGQWQAAKTELEVANRIMPKHYLIALNLGDVYWKLGEIESANQVWSSIHSIATFPWIQARQQYLIPLSDYLTPYELPHPIMLTHDTAHLSPP